MQWNNFTVLVFVSYMFILPLFICFDKVISKSDIGNLLIFDILFMIDRCADLFVGSFTLDGMEETSLWNVIQKNYENKFLLEILISFGPLLLDTSNMNSIIYALFKFPRYFRLFEIDSQIGDIMEYYEDTHNYDEKKSFKHTLTTLQFFTQTAINLHFFTSMMILVCQHRDKWEESWMGSRDIDQGAHS